MRYVLGCCRIAFARRNVSVHCSISNNFAFLKVQLVLVEYVFGTVLLDTSFGVIWSLERLATFLSECLLRVMLDRIFVLTVSSFPKFR